MAVMVDIRVEGANLRSGSCLVSQNGSSRSLPGGLAPVSIAVDAGVFSCCEGCGRQAANWVNGSGKAGLGLVIGALRVKSRKPCCLGGGEQCFLWENWPLEG